MKIDSIYMERFKTRFLKPFQISNRKYYNRHGWYIKIKCNNLIGVGEISPLPNYSPDYNFSIEKKIKEIIENSNSLSLYALKDNIKNSFSKYPSIQFGFETAIYDLLSKEKNIPLSKYWNKNYKKKILCNSIINIDSDINKIKDVVKIKITLSSIKKNLSFLNSIVKKNPNVKLRLDFNGSLDLNEAKIWVKELANFNIDYIEQPLPHQQIEELSDLYSFTNIPIALDESIDNIDSAYEIIEKKCADLFIIKPMISGGYINSKNIVDLAGKNNIKCIITSTLETEIGFLANVHIASALNIVDYCGLSTWDLYLENTPLYVMNNNIVIPNKPGLGY